jgi:4-hydroxy-tetrahydrodipicolinate synthase
MQDALFGGVNAAALTAMKPDLSPDLDRFAAHCQWLLANGCNGLGILGTTGEATSFGFDERRAILEGILARGVPAAKLMPGTGTASLMDTVELTKHAKAQGCRGVLVLPPFYYKGPSDDGLFAWFSEVVNRVGGGIAIYLYHFPSNRPCRSAST